MTPSLRGNSPRNASHGGPSGHVTCPGILCSKLYFQSMFSTLTTSMFPPDPDYEGTDIPGLTVVANTYYWSSLTYGNLQRIVTAIAARVRAPTWPGGRAPTDARAPA